MVNFWVNSDHCSAMRQVDSMQTGVNVKARVTAGGWWGDGNLVLLSPESSDVPCRALDCVTSSKSPSVDSCGVVGGFGGAWGDSRAAAHRVRSCVRACMMQSVLGDGIVWDGIGRVLCFREWGWIELHGTVLAIRRTVQVLHAMII